MKYKVTICSREACIKHCQYFDWRLLIKLHHRLIQWVFVLLQPASDVVVNSASVVHQGEVSLRLAFHRFGLQKAVVLAKMLVIQFVLERGVCWFWEHALFLQDGENPHWLGEKLLLFTTSQFQHLKDMAGKSHVQSQTNNELFNLQVLCVCVYPKPDISFPLCRTPLLSKNY